MKIQLESYGHKYTVETPNDDLDIYEYLEIIIGLLQQSGFQKETIDEGFKDYVEGLNEGLNN